MKHINLIFAALAVSFYSTNSSSQSLPSKYSIINKISLPGESGWDYLSIEPSSGRLFVSRGTMVQVVGVKDGKLIGTIPNTPGVHGIALAEDLGKGFISDGADSSVTVIDLKTLNTMSKIGVTGRNPDAILYDPYTQRVFTCNGRTSNSTVIDAKTNEVVGTISLSGRPEFSVTDGQGRVYINIEDRSEIDEIDPKEMKVLNVWPISPGESPSGLAIDSKNRVLFSVCHNKMMAVVNAETGKVITTLPIDERVDGAAFDPGLMRAFSSNGVGNLTVVQEVNPDSFVVVQSLETQVGARTVALDSTTHHLYLPTADFNPPPAATPENPRPRPTIKPGSFVIVEVAESK